MASLFFSYSHKDEDLRDALETHLAMLKRQGLIEAMHDRRIVAGEPLDDAIDAYLEAADVILCLASPDFIASEYCYSREMARALERHGAGEAVVIPVILRHCEWHETPLKGLRATPRDGKPVKAWADTDEALNDVAVDVRRAVEKRAMGQRRQTSPKSRSAIATGEPEIRHRPRSANLHVPRELTDRDRDDYTEAAFEFIVEYLANSLDELERRNPQLSGKLSRLDARRFSAALYRKGQKESAITVYIGSGWGRGRSISFNLDDRGDTSVSNGSFDVPDHGDSLHFKSLFQASSGEKATLNREEVAEAIWAAFIEPLQR